MVVPSNLSPREIAFCRNIASGYNKSTSALEAGYSPNGAPAQATRLLKKEKIKAYITYLETRKQVTTIDYSEADIVKNLLDIGIDAYSDKEYHAAIRANELLGKHKGMFKDRVEHSGNVGIIFQGEHDLKD